MIEPHEDEPRLAKEFAQMTIDALAEARREPDCAEARRTEQIEFARRNYSWPARALEWEASDIVADCGARPELLDGRMRVLAMDWIVPVSEIRARLRRAASRIGGQGYGAMRSGGCVLLRGVFPPR